MRLMLTAMLLLSAATAHADTRVFQSVSRAWSATGLGVVDLDVPAGELRVEAGSDDSVRVTMLARCAGSLRRCADKAERLTLVTDRRDRHLHLRLKGVPKLDWDGLSVELRVEVPKSCEVTVDMGAGELVVRDVERDLDVDMGVGDVTVIMPGNEVRSVELRLTIGDATLRTPDGTREASGVFGNRLDWHRGPGSARVDVGLKVGSVDVRLH